MIGTKLENLLQQRGKTVSELARELGISPQTLYSMIRRDSMKVDLDLLMRICDNLDVRPEYFSQLPPASLPDAEESLLLRRIRSLDAHGRDIVDRVISAEESRLAQSRREGEASSLKIIPLYRTPAAAGYAAPALGEDYDDYEVPADSPADFAARIQGDSMEPVIPDGSLVLGTDNGVFSVDPLHETVERVAENVIWSIFKDAEGGLWYGSDTGLLYSGKDRLFRTLSVTPASANNLYSSICSDGEGRIFAGGSYGVLVFRDDDGQGTSEDEVRRLLR